MVETRFTRGIESSRGLRRAAVVALVVVAGCATLQQIAALRQVDFALREVRNGELAGVSLARVANYRDLSAVELGRIAYAVARDDVPLEFQLDIAALNPADNGTTATMLSLAWSVFLDEKETVSGVLDTNYVLPPGQEVIIPLHVAMNLRRFFDGPAESLIDLAAGLVGIRSDPTRIAVRATPTISTPLGPIRYPTPITIVNRTIGGSSP
jgi:hypothetical protein